METVKQSEASEASEASVLIHLIKSCIGSGILTTPIAFKYAGLVAGALCLILASVICAYCTYLIINCSNYISKVTGTTPSSFAEVACKCSPSWAHKYIGLIKQEIIQHPEESIAEEIQFITPEENSVMNVCLSQSHVMAPSQKRYVGDINYVTDFSTPKKAKQNFEFAANIVMRQRAQISTLQQKVRQLENKMHNIEDILRHLKSNIIYFDRSFRFQRNVLFKE
ncbi:hypothetical protein FQA39_LY06577 [Lamprigera yunnana]|nr:hypothetical protein FQA39_LY06577 [Lamprigera yunnana]